MEYLPYSHMKFGNCHCSEH